jgi:periplasmic protein CpxP/Spy
MRKFLLLTSLAAATVIAAGIAVQAQTYGPGMMGQDQGYSGHRGYGGGYGMMGGGYGPGYMGGYGMMGYGSADAGSGRGGAYRGKRLCWQETDSGRGYGYYAACSK